MPKISISAMIAIVIHILIVLVITFLIVKKPNSHLINTDKVINLNFGKISEKKNHQALRQNSSKVSQLSIADSVATSRPESTGFENNLNDGVSEGESIYNFDNLAVSYKSPTYPKIAIRRGLEGSVKIRVMVARDGSPINTEILVSSGHDLLDNAALEAARYWKFQLRDDSYTLEKTIIFELKK